MFLKKSRTKSTITTACTVACIACSYSLSGLTLASEFQTVALRYTQAPDADAGVNYVDLAWSPTINNAGQVLFIARLGGTGIDLTNNSVIYLADSDGTVNRVVQSGDSASFAGPDVVFTPAFAGNGGSSSGDLNNSGHVAFRTRLEGTGITSSNADGIFIAYNGQIAELARARTQAAGMEPGVIYQTISTQSAMDLAGRSALNVGLSGTNIDASNNGGIFFGSPGNFILTARKGDQAPDAPLGVLYSTFSPTSSIESGGFAFYAELTGAGVDSTNDHAIYKKLGDNPVYEAIRAGDPLVGAAPGTIVSAFSRPGVNSNGQLYFKAALSGPGIDPSNNVILFEEAGSFTVLASDSQQAPGAEPGVIFGNIVGTAVNSSGKAALRTQLSGPGTNSSNNTGIYIGSAGTFTEVARTGNQVPEAEAGVVFSELSTYTINELGQILLFATLTGPSELIDGSNTGIYATNLDGDLIKIIRKGDTIDVNNDPLIEDLRTVSDLRISISSSTSSGFNDQGQVAFVATFTNGTKGVFVSNAVAVPEPASAVLLASPLP